MANEEFEILCPHNKIVEMDSILGVIYYVHQDTNQSCPLLNRFDMTAEKVLLTVMKENLFEDSPALRGVLSAKGEIQKEIFAQLDALVGEDFKQYLSTVVKIYTSYQLGHDYIRYLIERYGDVMVQNIKSLCGQDFSQFMMVGKKYTQCYDLRLLGINDVRKQMNDKVAAREKAIRGMKQP